MVKKTVLFVFIVFIGNIIFAQPVESIILKNMFGFSIGGNEYFGDLNPQRSFKNVTPTFQLFYQINLSNKFSIKYNFDYHFIEYADSYNEQNNIDLKARNLSFKNDVVGLSAQVIYHFVSFNPLSKLNKFTSYFGLGVGIIYTNPYSMNDNNNVIYLRPLITERLNKTDNSPTYNQFAFIAPFSLGIKYKISRKIDLFSELNYTLAFTDYLDDVSKNYAGKDAFVNDKVANYFQDRSKDQFYGILGKKRGDDSKYDAIFSFRLGFILNNFNSYYPTIK